MNRSATRVSTTSLVVAGLLGGALALVPTAAMAAVPTAIQFVDTTTATAAFGDDWSFVLLTSMDYDGAITTVPDPTSATVTVMVSGIGGEFATGLPIQPDGRVYVSQPVESLLLPAGDYDITAILVPAPGSQLATSQTPTAARLTITALEANAKVEVVNDAAVSKYPIITAELSGSYLEARDGAPAGTWTFSAKNEAEKEVFATEIAQVEGEKDPIRVEIDSKLEAGANFAVTSTFTPAEEYTGGVTVAPIPTATFSTPGTTFLDTLAARLPFPWWLVLGVGVLLAALVAAVVILGVKLSKRPDTGEKKLPPTIPGEPVDVELMSLEDAGISEIEPPIQSWSLSANEPAELPQDQSKGEHETETPTPNAK